MASSKKQKPAKAPKITHPLAVGANLVIRTVTMITVGTVVSFDDDEILFTNASWVADAGNWGDVFKKGFDLSSHECALEHYPADMVVVVNRKAIVDYSAYPFDVPAAPVAATTPDAPAA